MSWVTDVVVLVHVDYAPDEALEALEGEFHAGYHNSGNPRMERLGRLSTEEAGGSKVFTGRVYAGSFNHMDSDMFISWLASLPWKSYSQMTVSIAAEMTFYSFFRLHDGVLTLEDRWSE